MPNDAILATAIEDLAGGVEPENVLAWIQDPAWGLDPQLAIFLYAQAADAVNTALEITPGSDLVPSALDNGIDEVTVVIDVTQPLGDGSIASKPVTIKVPKSSKKTIWEQVVSDFWKWYREEYSSGTVKPGSAIPTFEIIGVY